MRFSLPNLHRRRRERMRRRQSWHRAFALLPRRLMMSNSYEPGLDVVWLAPVERRFSRSHCRWLYRLPATGRD